MRKIGRRSFIGGSVGAALAFPALAAELTVAPSDKIVLDDAIFSAIGSTLDAGEFRAATGATTGADADDRIILNLNNGLLYYDADGNDPGASAAFTYADGSAELWNALSASDFLIA